MTTQLPTAAQAKDQAKRLREKLASEGTPMGHAKSLEHVAHDHGFRDWNALSAAINAGPQNTWGPGDRVTGTYLSQPFTAQVVASVMQSPGWVQLDLQLDEAIDVVTSEGFSNLRRRIRGVVGPKGHSVERTSDGRAHLEIALLGT